MITEHDLAEAIAECEGQRNPSANTCLKLAAFYTIRDKMYPAEQEKSNDVVMPNLTPYSYSMSAGPIDIDANTEFLQTVHNMDYNQLLPVMDELMTAVKTVMPRLYDGVMRKLTNM